MASTSSAIPVQIPSEDERAYIASQWKLIWWRFVRHRIAMASGIVLLMFYLVAVMPEFLAIHDPTADFAKRAYVPPQRIHLFNGIVPAKPYVYGFSGSRNPVTLAMEYVTDESAKFNLQFFTRGFEYKLLGFIPTDRHLMGIDSGEEVMQFYPFGTDRMGRDMFSRLAIATRISMSIGLVGVALNIFLGVLLGGISGYRGGLADLLIQRLIEFLRAMPPIPLWLALAAAVPATWSQIRLFFAITIIISLIQWTRLAREVRGRFLAMREEDFVVAAKLYGSSELRIIFRHMLPSFMSHIIAATTLAVPGIIIAETALSFLGIGLRQPTISWGVLLFEAQKLQAVANAPWLLLPGLFVLVAVLAFNFLGDGLRDAADPYAKR